VWSSAVSAATVNYSTSGKFSLQGGSGSSLSMGISADDTITNGGISIQYFAAASPVGGVATPTNIGLGQFTVTGTTTGTFADNFTLTLTQTVPLPGGSQDFGTASVSGTIVVNGSEAFVQFTSPLTLTFAGSPTTIYAITSADGTPPIAGRVALNAPSVDTGSGLGTSTIQGRVIAVPLPPAVWAGMSLMGLMGIKGFRRQRLIKSAD